MPLLAFELPSVANAMRPRGTGYITLNELDYPKMARLQGFKSIHVRLTVLDVTKQEETVPSLNKQLANCCLPC